MTIVTVAKQIGLTPFFERSFDDVSEAARFVQSWLPMHVTARNEAGEALDIYRLSHAAGRKESALLPFENDDGSDALCPFCGAPEATILADDELLHACEACDRAWYIDSDENMLPADRCPACEAETITAFDDGHRLCTKCGHSFFFDGLAFVDSSTVESEGAE